MVSMRPAGPLLQTACCSPASPAENQRLVASSMAGILKQARNCGVDTPSLRPASRALRLGQRTAMHGCTAADQHGAPAHMIPIWTWCIGEQETQSHTIQD